MTATKQANMMLRQAIGTLKNITRSSAVLEMDKLSSGLFALQHTVNLLTKEIQLAIITKDEAGAESNDYTCTEEDKKIISDGGFSAV